MATDVSFEARLDNLHGVLGWVEQACVASGVGEEETFALVLAAEEVFANVIRHGYASRAGGELRLAFHADASAASVVIEDDAPAYDPAGAPPPDLDSDWDERQPGGLGWHLVRQFVDEVRHETLGERGNRITLTKRRSRTGDST